MAEAERNTIKKFAIILGTILHWVKTLVGELRKLESRDIKYFKEIKDYCAAKKDIKDLLARKNLSLNFLAQDYFQGNAKHMLFIRLDYWTKNSVGGSITHTINVIKEFHQVGIHVTAVLPRDYPELTAYGIEQIILPCPKFSYNKAILSTNRDFLNSLDAILSSKKIDFIYERTVPGMYAGAKVADKWQIPYIVEYNGSEKIMNATFSTPKNLHQAHFDSIDDIVFHHADAIVTVSDTNANYLVANGVNAEKILVNPNGADPNVYFPSEEIYTLVRKKFKISESDVLVGFVGTFGGWHGIDVIADSIMYTLQQNKNIRYLLIGDGMFFPQIENLVNEQKINDRVILARTVDAQTAVQYLQACDIYLSPQTNKLKGALFYGSPIKLFEYMALGKAIIASKLMQIGQVLQPALNAADLPHSNPKVDKEVAVLIPPGDVEKLITSILYLAENNSEREKMGHNVRSVFIQRYTWKDHVERIMAFATKQPSDKWLVPEVLNPAGQYLTQYNKECVLPNELQTRMNRGNEYA